MGCYGNADPNFRRFQISLPFVAKMRPGTNRAEGGQLKKAPVYGRALSSRQRECLFWVRHGKSSADIAKILSLSSHSVDGHIAEACRKLGVRTRVQAVAEACLSGLIDE